ncbi:hypothetical protein G3M48_001832 [Beauveria asiatica]|uniref:Uncharacterized protein n=1 Tax=Beauveria asiatica TaxID=1069075 RepID=A0AAW0RF62_9HYPO
MSLLMLAKSVLFIARVRHQIRRTMAMKSSFQTPEMAQQSVQVDQFGALNIIETQLDLVKF